MGRRLLFVGLVALLAGVVVASAAAVRVDGGVLQVFTLPAEIDIPPPKLTFLLPSDTELTIEGGSGPGQQIITIGGEVSITDSGDCSDMETLPVQNAVVTDPNVQGARLLISELVPLVPEPLASGTKLRNVVRLTGQCTIEDTEFNRYRADME